MSIEAQEPNEDQQVQEVRPEIEFDIRLKKEKAVRKDIETWLDTNGYKRGLHGFCKHKKGLPTIPNVMVRPSHSDSPGSRTLMVTPNSVIDATIKDPYKDNRWAVKTVVPYSSLDELKKVLDDLAYLELHAWAVE
jgi:hypothetical protein